MIPAEAARKLALNARRNARFHVQATLLDRSYFGWARARIERVFRGAEALAGDEVLFCVPVRQPWEGVDPDDPPWTSASNWNRTRHVEVFLNGDPPHCVVAGLQWMRLARLTQGAQMSAEHLESALPDQGDLDTSGADVVGDPTDGILAARLVFTAGELAAHGHDVQPGRDASNTVIDFRPHFQPAAFDEAFRPGYPMFAVSHAYKDASRPSCVDSLFVQTRNERAAQEWFDDKRNGRIRGLVKGDLMGTFDVTRFDVTPLTETPVWSGRSASFALDVNDRRVGTAFLGVHRAWRAYCMIAGFTLQSPESTGAVLTP